MIIENKTEGTFIEHKLSGTKLTLNNELQIDLAARERDHEVRIDIGFDSDGALTTTAGRRYVAQIIIPARSYNIVETGQVDEDGSPYADRVAVAFDTAKVTLIRWALEVA